jgi:3-oxosteroid 1-dehydrogenase
VDLSRAGADTNASFDLIVVGGGGGGIVAAMTASAHGLRTLLVEKQPHLGGSTAMSGGVLWLPGNALAKGTGIEDSPEAGLRYLEAVVGDSGPATSRARKEAFVYGGNEMLSFLLARQVGLRCCPTFPDDYPDHPDGRAGGRPIKARKLFHGQLGGWAHYLHARRRFPIDLDVDQGRDAALALRTPVSFARTARIVATTARGRLKRDLQLSMGYALAGRLLLALQACELTIWTSSPAGELITDDQERVRGVVVERGSRAIPVRSALGVILASGGFDRNPEMRTTYQPPIDGTWSAGNPGNTGDAIRAAEAVGAATDMMDNAIWIPSSMNAQGSMVPHTFERSLPHSIIVDSEGHRYINEAGPYMEVGRAMYRHQLGGPALPSYLILESRHRRRYPFMTSPAGITPRAWIDSGFMVRADSVSDLAVRCGIDPTVLQATIGRFNHFADTGADEDFHRGATIYDRYFGDPSNRPNACLGRIEKGPFYAVRNYLGDVGTTGGIVADEHARALRTDGSVIDGLYATGNTAASVHGRVYPGPGASIAASMAFGYLAALHAVGVSTGGATSARAANA